MHLNGYLPSTRDMAQDFKDQTLLNPRLKNTVGHISLSFSTEDAARMTDRLMTRVAKEYMRQMGITDTQFLLVRHLDQPHPHCHLVYNRVGNNGQTVSDNNIKLRNAKVCRELTEKYGLYLPTGKEHIRQDRLLEPDKIRYEIYDAIKHCISDCHSWADLESRLQKQGIAIRYKQCGATGRKQGVLFSKNGREFSGSKIDRSFSFSKLDSHFAQAQHRATLAKNLSTAASSYRSAFAALFGNTRGGSNAQTEPSSLNLGGAIEAIPLAPAGSPVGVTAAQLQRKPGESAEEYIARITALLNTAAEAMAVAAMEQKRKFRDRKTNKPKLQF